MFSHFFDYFLFLKILTKKQKKKSLFGQNFSFLGQNAKIFKNKILIKKKWANIP